MTLAIAHRDKERGVLDALRERKPPFSPDDVVHEFSELLKAYRINRVSGDRYAGEWPREAFRKAGITYEPSERTKSQIYTEALPLLNASRVELLDHPRLIAQLCGLERRTARGGRDSIDHAPGGHDDVANAAAGALVLAGGRTRKRIPSRPGRKSCWPVRHMSSVLCNSLCSRTRILDHEKQVSRRDASFEPKGTAADTQHQFSRCNSRAKPNTRAPADYRASKGRSVAKAVRIRSAEEPSRTFALPVNVSASKFSRILIGMGAGESAGRLSIKP